MASNVVRAFSRRACLALRSRSLVEVRPYSAVATPAIQSCSFLSRATLFNCSLPLEKKLQSNVNSVRGYGSGSGNYDEEPLPTPERVLNVCKAFDKINADIVTPDSHFMNDLGLDSLDHVELIMAAEDEFGFEIPDVDAERLLTVKTLIEYIEEKIEGSVDIFEDLVPKDYVPPTTPS